MTIPIPIGASIRQARLALQLSQRELAACCGLSRPRLSAVERGYRSPNQGELERLAAHLGRGILEGTDMGLAGVVPVPAAMQADPPDRRRPPFEFASYLRSARKVYARLVPGLERRLVRDSRLRFLRDLWVDSAIEAVYWLQMGVECRGAGTVSPQALGMRQHPIVCPHTEEVVGDLAHHCLVLDEAVLFPQVTILVGSRRYRLDCLACVGPGLWLNLEIDGSGHDSTWDARRDNDIRLPVWRFRERDVLDPGFAKRLRDRLSTAAAGPTAAV